MAFTSDLCSGLHLLMGLLGHSRLAASRLQRSQRRGLVKGLLLCAQERVCLFKIKKVGIFLCGGSAHRELTASVLSDQSVDRQPPAVCGRRGPRYLPTPSGSLAQDLLLVRAYPNTRPPGSWTAAASSWFWPPRRLSSALVLGSFTLDWGFAAEQLRW